MSFMRFWLGFTLFGVSAAVALLAWALRGGLFREPDRAACLPLADLPATAIPARRWSCESIGLVSILGAGVALLAAATVLSVIWTW
jgi:hypothetical protein